jgi:hypothetical protein
MQCLTLDTAPRQMPGLAATNRRRRAERLFSNFEGFGAISFWELERMPYGENSISRRQSVNYARGRRRDEKIIGGGAMGE